MYVWHGAEEIEHKSVAFDTMQKAAHAGYFMRVFALLAAVISFSTAMVLTIDHMLRVDGFSLKQRLGMWVRGAQWYYGKEGPFRPIRRHFLAYFLPGFHPNKYGGLEGYEKWRDAFARTGDVLASADAVR